MARKRMIDPEFWNDEEIGNWSHTARLFYIGLWNFADDEGRFKAANALLKAQVFPYDKKINIENLKKELGNKIQWYEVNGLQYGFICNFSKHQRIDKPTPSKLPIPRTLPDDSTNTPGILPPKRREEKLIEVNKREPLYVDFEKSTIEAWNSFVDHFPILSKIHEVSEKRRLKLKKRYEQKSFRDFNKILECIKQQPFCLGENDRKWTVCFDWIIENDTNYLKVLEFKYKSNGHQDDKLRADFGLLKKG